MKIKNKFNKNILILLIVILSVILIFLAIQNLNLKNEVASLNKDVKGAIDNFNLFLIDKVGKCEAVTLMVEDKSATVNNIHCE